MLILVFFSPKKSFQYHVISWSISCLDKFMSFDCSYFELQFRCGQAEKVTKNAYEMPFPYFIVAVGRPVVDNGDRGDQSCADIDSNSCWGYVMQMFCSRFKSSGDCPAKLKPTSSITQIWQYLSANLLGFCSEHQTHRSGWVWQLEIKAINAGSPGSHHHWIC